MPTIWQASSKSIQQPTCIFPLVFYVTFTKEHDLYLHNSQWQYQSEHRSQAISYMGVICMWGIQSNKMVCCRLCYYFQSQNWALICWTGFLHSVLGPRLLQILSRWVYSKPSIISKRKSHLVFCGMLITYQAPLYKFFCAFTFSMNIFPETFLCILFVGTLDKPKGVSASWSLTSGCVCVQRVKVGRERIISQHINI